MSHLSEANLQFLAQNGFVVVKDFLSSELQAELREDVVALREANKFAVAKIGHNGMIQDETTPYKDIRDSETCFIGRAQGELEAEMQSKARLELYQILDHLRTDLESTCVKEGPITKGIPALDTDLEELMYAYYPQGGYYRRHRDAEPNSESNWRKYSFLLYLNEPGWTESDGGQLRLHRDSGGDHLPPNELPNFLDVLPAGGTLVVFRSDRVPHEVLDTRKERVAIVGWFLSGEVSTEFATDAEVEEDDLDDRIAPATLTALRALRDASPRLASRLKPAPPVSNNGLLGDDFVFPGMGTPPPLPPPPQEPTYEDTDPRYWKKIAAFGLGGHITTLSLGANRLRALPMADALFENAITIDLGNTDLTVEQMVKIINGTKQLKHLHLGGNALGDEGLTKIVSESRDAIVQLQTLDLRYNDIGAVGAGLLGDMLAVPPPGTPSWTALYLEGNTIGSEGAACLVEKGNLRELFLGQNQIGPEGAKGLAKKLGKVLKKLYLEGNQIGPEGAQAFITGLAEQKDSPLEKLFVDNNGIGKELSVALGEALNCATTIGGGSFFQE